MIDKDVNFEDPGQNMLTSLSLATAALGIATNVLVTVFFFQFTEEKRIQNSLWTNVSLSYLFKCLVIIYSALGDLIDDFSDSKEKCRLRYSLPISIDLVCMNCYLMLLVERTACLHCPAFYSLIPQISTLMHLFGWCYGFAFLMFIELKLQEYECPIRCNTPYIHMVPVDPTPLFSFIKISVLIVISLTSMLFLYPANYSNVEKIRLQMEINGTYLVIAFGTALIVLWIPKQITTGLFWIEKIGIANYTISMKLTGLIVDLTVLLPFIALLGTLDFRKTICYMITMKKRKPINRRLLAKNNYKGTVRKSAENENPEQKRTSISIQSNNGTVNSEMEVTSKPVTEVNADSTSSITKPQAAQFFGMFNKSK